MIPQHRRTVDRPTFGLRDRVAIATDDGRRVEGWIVGFCMPAGQPLFDVLEDHEAPPAETRRIHHQIPPARIALVEAGTFGRESKRRAAA